MIIALLCFLDMNGSSSLCLKSKRCFEDISGRENKLNIDTDLNSVRVSLYLIHSGRDK